MRDEIRTNLLHPSSFILSEGESALDTSALRAREFRRILLIKPSAVGDVIHTLPVLAKLRARYPTARIDWLLTRALAEWLRHHPALSNVVPFARRNYARWWRSWSAASGLARL